MKRNYIGLACTGHDNALSIVNSDGEVVFAEAAERYLQNKRAMNSPPDDLLRVDELVGCYCEPDAELVLAKTWSSKAFDILRREEALTAERFNRMEGGEFSDLLAADMYIISYVHSFIAYNVEEAGQHFAFRCQSALNRQTVIKSYNHHYTHAATACFTSPCDDAVCAIVDGFGEGVSLSFFSYNDGRIKHLQSSALEGEVNRSMGVFYGGLLCGLCGFDIWKGEEWKVMGLAPYGKRDDKVYELLHECLKVNDLVLECPPGRPAAIIELFAHARQPGEPPEAAADLAYTGQLVFSELMSELLNNLYARGLSDNLVLGGGCALNSAYNGKILEQTKFNNLHVYSAPGDDGNALGAALLAFSDDQTRTGPRARFQTPYLGSTMSSETLDNMKRFGRLGGFSELPGKVHERAAQLLAEGKIIGWVQGRAEYGPRALGNRSILADPRHAGMKDRINALVKFREEFRPFAPSILHEYGDEYFVDYQESPYMERTLVFREAARSRVPAVVHVDGTGRLQTVKRQWNPKYYDLISAFRRITGVPVILNTSFNIMGKPIIHSVEDAVATFYTTGLDALVIEDCLIEKP